MQVNAETLQEKIHELMRQPHLSIKEEYTLRAFFELRKRLQKEEEQCQHEWFKGKGAGRCCADCGKEMPKHD